MDEVIEVFPRLSQLPDQVSAHLQKMIDCFKEATLRGDVREFRGYKNIYNVLDTNGNLRCLFKEVHEKSAIKEACVYLLDHPYGGHRSQSQQIYGFSGVPPTIFVRDRMGIQNRTGFWVEFVECEDNINEDCPHGPLEEIHKIVVADLRFGNIDRSPDNLLLQRGEGENRYLVPIDHENTFEFAYNISKPCWLRWLRDNEAFSPRCVNYIEQLNPDTDIQFLRLCGWEPEESYTEKFKVFATFLRVAVFEGLTPFHIGTIASGKCENIEFNLASMVNGVTRDDMFYDRVEIHLQELVKEYLKHI